MKETTTRKLILACAALAVAASASAMTPEPTVDVQIGRVTSRQAVVAFITVTSTPGVRLKGDLRVMSASRDVALIPVDATGSFSLSVPIAKIDTPSASACVKLLGEVDPGGTPEGFGASDCATYVAGPPSYRPPERRPPSMPMPGDVSVMPRGMK